MNIFTLEYQFPRVFLGDLNSVTCVAGADRSAQI